MAVAAAKMELTSLSKFQRMLHYPQSKEGKDEEDKKVRFTFNYKFEYVSWSTQALEIMACTNSEENYTFIANSKFDFLRYSYLVQTLPALQVKHKYKDTVQICWCRYPGHNIVQMATLCIDEEPIQTIDNIWLDIRAQYYMQPGKREQYQTMVGNLKFLTEWADSLPTYNLCIPQPWDYANNPYHMIPLVACSEGRVIHRYKFRCLISSLLRMRKKENGVWKEIPYNWKYMKGMTSSDKIPQPELWGRYVKVSDGEIKARKALETEKKIPPLEYYTEDMVIIKNDNTYKLGNNIDIGLQCNMPAKAIFWVAENMKASDLNNYSNYSTDPSDIKYGWSPWNSVGLNHASTPKLDNLGFYHVTQMEAWQNFPSAPSEPGYGAYSFSYDTTSIHADISIEFRSLNSKLTLGLNDTNPFTNNTKITNHDDEEDSSSENQSNVEQDEAAPEKNKCDFKIHVRILTMKKIMFDLETKKTKVISEVL